MKSNPADIASRGAGAQELIDNPLWWNGPEFLWSSLEDWNFVDEIPSIPNDDPEVKISVRATQIEELKPSSILERLTYFSSWHRAKRAIAVCLRLQQKFRRVDASVSQDGRRNVKKRDEGIASYKLVDVQELRHAELHIIKIVQHEAFPDEMQRLEDVKGSTHTRQDQMKAMRKSSSICKLDPFLDEDGTLQVGGHLRESSIPYDVKHPAILPKKGHITNLILCYYHQSVKHQGHGITQNEIRSSGYWIVGSSVVSNHISRWKRLLWRVERAQMSLLETK